MRRRFVRVAARAMLAAAVDIVGMAGHAHGDTRAVAKVVWIVELEAATSAGVEGRTIARQHGGDVRHVYQQVLNGYSFTGTESQAAAAARHPKVRRVEADRPVRAHAQSVPTGVRRIDADDSTAAGITGSGTVVAVIDTGVDLNHPDLAGNINSTGKDCINNDAVAQDDAGHGTHVAGTIAALNNTAGVVGVAPAIKIEPVKVLDSSGSGSWASVICGIDYVTSKAATVTVANMSLGGSSSDDATNCASSTLHQAICDSVNAGVFYAVAAGNDGTNASGEVPAKYDQVTTVSALEDTDGAPGGLGGCKTDGPPSKQYCDDALAPFSNYGSAVDVIAPGVDILSTYWNDTYATASGTSMASPHVAGVAALVRSLQPDLTPAELQAHLKTTGQCPDGTTSGASTCTDKGTWTGDPDGVTEPIVNALTSTAGDTTTTDPTDPTEPAQNTAPSASIASPTAGATVNGTVVVQVAASDSEDGADSLVVEVSIDGGAWLPAAHNTSSGHHEYSWDTSLVAEGDHAIDARATDSAAGTTNAARVSVTVDNETAAPATASDDISAVQFGGKHGANHVDVTTTITADGLPVAGATVSVTITRNGVTWSTPSGTTNSAGQVVWAYRGIASGSYVATVTSVNPPAGQVWDAAGDTVAWSK